MENNVYSQAIADAIQTFLREDDWKFQFDEEKGVFTFDVKLRNKLTNIRYIICVSDENYTVYAISPISADESDNDMMQKMAEFVCRANYGLENGNFELDMRDGEISYKCFVDCEDFIPSTSVISNSIQCPGKMFRLYSPGILAIIFGDATAKEAVDLCENN